MKYAIRLLGISCTFIMCGTWIFASQPATPQGQPMAPGQLTQPAPQDQPKMLVKITNHSGYNATITYHYYKIPENNPTHSSAILEKGATTTPPLELLPNTPFSFSLSAEGIKSPDIQVSPGEYSSGFYEIKPPAAPLIVPIIRQVATQPVTPTPLAMPTNPAPAQPTPPTPPAKP